MTNRLAEAEFRFMNIVWDNEPVASGNLVKLCRDQLGWKKSTTYTVLKNVSEKGFAQNIQYVITSTVSREEAQKRASDNFMEKTFNGSLPSFLAAFFDGKKISNEEAEALKKLIDEYKE